MRLNCSKFLSLVGKNLIYNQDYLEYKIRLNDYERHVSSREEITRNERHKYFKQLCSCRHDCVECCSALKINNSHVFYVIYKMNSTAYVQKFKTGLTDRQTDRQGVHNRPGSISKSQAHMNRYTHHDLDKKPSILVLLRVSTHPCRTASSTTSETHIRSV
jgi:hypothetical protein